MLVCLLLSFSFIHILFSAALLDPKTRAMACLLPALMSTVILGIMLSRHELKSWHAENRKFFLFVVKDLEKVVPAPCLVLTKLKSFVRVFSGSCQRSTTL